MFLFFLLYLLSYFTLLLCLARCICSSQQGRDSIDSLIEFSTINFCILSILCNNIYYFYNASCMHMLERVYILVPDLISLSPSSLSLSLALFSLTHPLFSLLSLDIHITRSESETLSNCSPKDRFTEQNDQGLGGITVDGVDVCML